MFSLFRPKKSGMSALVVGLGNPGRKYARTRHNLGFGAVEALAKRHNFPPPREKFHGYFAEGKIGDDACCLLMPQTFMNLSGQAVSAALKKLGLSTEELIVVHDDLDLEFGRIKLKKGGGAGGHRGVADIAARLGDKEFIRIRMGVGRPAGDAVDYVLSPFDSSETAELPEFLDAAADAVEKIVAVGFEKAAGEFNSRGKRPAPN